MLRLSLTGESIKQLEGVAHHFLMFFLRIATKILRSNSGESKINVYESKTADGYKGRVCEENITAIKFIAHVTRQQTLATVPWKARRHRHGLKQTKQRHTQELILLTVDCYDGDIF